MSYVLPNCAFKLPTVLAGIVCALAVAACGSTPAPELAPVASAAVVPYGSATALGTPAFAPQGVRNEFGQVEYAPQRDVWPSPFVAEEEDGEDDEDSGDATTPDDARATADGTPREPAEALPLAGGRGGAPLPTPGALPEPMPAVSESAGPEGPVSLDPVLADANLPGAGPSDSTRLLEAKTLMRDGRFDEARRALAQLASVSAAETRAEARRGGIAIYNLKRIRAANGAERTRRLERAQRDLGSTFWGDLFS